MYISIYVYDKSPINPQHIFQIYPLNISPTGQLSEGAASGARSAMAAAGSRVSSGGNGWWIVSICLAGMIYNAYKRHIHVCIYIYVYVIAYYIYI